MNFRRKQILYGGVITSGLGLIWLIIWQSRNDKNDDARHNRKLEENHQKHEHKLEETEKKSECKQDEIHAKGDENRRNLEKRGEEDRETIQAKADAECQKINCKAEAEIRIIMARSEAAVSRQERAAADRKSMAERLVEPAETCVPHQEVRITNETIAGYARQAAQPLVGGWLYPNENAMMFGLEGEKKSILAVQIAISHCDSGADALALYYDVEPRGAALYERYLEHGFTFPGNMCIIDALSTCPSQDSLLSHIREKLAEAQRLGKSNVLVVFDNASDKNYDFDRRKGASRFVNELKKLRHEFEALTFTVLLVAHSKLKLQGNLRDADVEKSVHRDFTLIMRLRSCTDKATLVTVEKDSHGRMKKHTLMITSGKGYVHLKKSDSHSSQALLNHNERQRLIEALAGKPFNFSQAEIANLIGINKSNISRSLKKHGKHRRKRTKLPAVKEITANEERNEVATSAQ